MKMRRENGNVLIEAGKGDLFRTQAADWDAATVPGLTIYESTFLEMLVKYIDTLDFKQPQDLSAYDYIKDRMNAHFRTQE